ncbi:CHAT domain-containing tetratricopeptide repeat protein [Saccharothrix sp. S26]|uniref:CHAT domain-containing tetratricopeptide repeat protein n=1 Tax=Saccharothrix sp. S26 TaxID=2907215 RepID=UPI001F450140|nr:CHAT domain-containing tetratricopeptide repeat protein [Saccharothrix sp. S26]MCE6997270.1 CHAT domain-containing tetratricopeptide repeat protein [Saccharothrix sp. S26]
MTGGPGGSGWADEATAVSEEALACWTRAQGTGRVDEVDRAITLGGRAVAAAGLDHPSRMVFWANLGTYHLTRYRLTADAADLDRAIGWLTPAVAPPEGPDHGLFRYNLATCHLYRFDVTGDVADLDRAVEHFVGALAVTPAGPHRAAFLSSLGATCWRRFERTGRSADLDRAVEANREAVATGGDDPGLPTFLANLGVAEHTRFERTGDLADLDRAVEHLERAVAGTGPEDGELAGRASNLALARLARFQRTGRPADLDRALEAGRRAVAVAGDTPLRATFLGNLGIIHQTRFERTGDLADLDQAIDLKQRALAATRPDDPDLATPLTNLGMAYQARFRRRGDLADLDRAVDACRRALEVTPEGATGRVFALNNSASAHQERFQHTGDLTDLDRAIDLHQRAVASVPDGHAGLPLWLTNLGDAHRARYLRLGRSADLEQAIEVGRRAVAVIAADHPDRPLVLSNLGGVHQLRFERVGGLADLDRAIELKERAVAATPDDHAVLPVYLANLAAAHLARGKHLRTASDVDLAVDVGSRAVSLTPPDHPDRVLRLFNLAVAHRERCELTRATADADRAVELARQAVAGTTEGHPHHAACLSGLAGAHQVRYRLTGSPADAAAVAEVAGRALAATPPDHPSRAVRLYFLAQGHQNRVDVGADVPDLRRVEAMAAELDRLTAAPPADRVVAGWAVGRLAGSLGQAETARRVLAGAVELLPSVASRETTHTDRERLLGGRVGLVGEAIAAHCALGDAVGALRVAEQGRGILLAAQLDSRTDLTELEAAHPELAHRLHRVRDRLNAVDLGSDVVEHRRRLWAEYDAVLADVRRLPGLDRFLLPPTWPQLRQAVTGGAVVLVNAGRAHGDAIVVGPDAEPVHVPLPGLIARDVDTWATELAQAIDDRSAFAGELRRQRVVTDLLARLWDAAVGPVLDVVAPDPGRTPRVWWMPTGRLGLLPLHAAGPPGGPGALDRVTSSYTPTLRALAHARRRPAASSRRQLTVALTRTPGLPDLPATAAEAAGLHARRAGVLLTDEHATVDRVTAALAGSAWAHFACHAGIDADRPSEGALHLHDGVLPIAAISRLNPRDAELAYLSACSTGQASRRHADEVIHLASAFQLAGFRHVVAGLWPLDDRTAATAADRFYALLPAADVAAEALRQVVRELRAEQPDRPHLWASLVHSGL